MKTALQLKTEIRNQIWPSGEQEGLEAAHDLHFQEAFALISKWVPCEQQNNVSVIQFCKTWTKCGMTIVPAPKGVIKRVYTIVDGKFCDSVDYRMVKWPIPEWFAKNYLASINTLSTSGGSTTLGLGFGTADAANDSVAGRSRVGIFSISEGNIYLAPWIQSNESLVIEWDGIKKEWSDQDQVSEEQDYRNAVKLYVTYCHERDYGDFQKALLIHNHPKTGTFDEALADLIWQCRENTRLRETQVNPDQRLLHGADVLQAGLPPAAEAPAVIAQIGNWGELTENSEAVAELVENLGPDHVITSGNNVATLVGGFSCGSTPQTVDALQWVATEMHGAPSWEANGDTGTFSVDDVSGGVIDGKLNLEAQICNSGAEKTIRITFTVKWSYTGDFALVKLEALLNGSVSEELFSVGDHQDGGSGVYTADFTIASEATTRIGFSATVNHWTAGPLVGSFEVVVL